MDTIRNLRVEPKFPPNRWANVFAQLVGPLITEVTCLRSHELKAFHLVSAHVGSPPAGTRVKRQGPNKGRWIGPLGRSAKMALLSPAVSQRMVSFLAHQNKADLAVLGELLETGKVTPVIDRIYPLSEAAEAIGYLEQGHARGKVVITV